MYGNPMRIMLDRVPILLRPFEEKDIPGALLGMSKLSVRKWTAGIDAPSVATEREWFDDLGKRKGTYGWAIVPEGVEVAVGSTSLNGIDPRSNTAKSGIIVWEPSFWGKGIATRAHLARTLFASDWLNLRTIISEVRVPNEASLKALLRVGYAVTGKHFRDYFVEGRYWDTYVLTWTNPKFVQELWEKDPIPTDIQDAITRAEEALERARRCVEYL